MRTTKLALATMTGLALVAGLASCATPGTSTGTKTAAATSKPSPTASGDVLPKSSIRALDVVATFINAGLPETSFKDVSDYQCGENGINECTDWVTTPNIDVVKFTSVREAEYETKGGGGYLKGDIGLVFYKKGTAKDQQGKYIAALDKLWAEKEG
ncbi:hypothetical protein GCM10025867_49790 (plasmid) [Frondihabitans sucicola]|uniref:DUF3558 domain-containing protein n=1 Tax=Frondihabitans sucicola TaxID=1268041 RepID=A0ABM8GW86_9MICO|nr:hypothetical protein [Frondihabitans sucicola]BDZ52738.1 hypothetical protein GCM10025867_49790 [Frondihabitans sucicola]